MVRLIFFTAALLVGALPTHKAQAHLGLLKPTSRLGADVLKDGPCGQPGSTRGNNITAFAPGDTIEVMWEEYVDHDSHYRIAFDDNGDDGFEDPATMMEMFTNDAVLVDGISDANGGFYRASVTLPDIECDNCTLQVIQVMYDKPPYTVGGNDIYYQCADLVLSASIAPGDGGVRLDAGSEQDAGVNPEPDNYSGSGCAVGLPTSGKHPLPMSLALLCAALVCRRR